MRKVPVLFIAVTLVVVAIPVTVFVLSLRAAPVGASLSREQDELGYDVDIVNIDCPCMDFKNGCNPNPEENMCTIVALRRHEGSYDRLRMPLARIDAFRHHKSWTVVWSSGQIISIEKIPEP